MRLLPKKATKNHIGYNKHLVRLKYLGKSHSTVFNTLIVKGTLDNLTKVWLYTTKTKKEHPVDKGYYKEVLVLNNLGRKKLERYKK